LYKTQSNCCKNELERSTDPSKNGESSLMSSKQNKYKTSALTEDNLQHIANKLENAMLHEQLYLDASLSLPKLAKSISISSNYISQTLNVRLNVNFFDYVNGYRVKHAKNELTNSNKTVLDIAMDAGFNSKSAFYTAFKKYTGKTPVQYKQQSLS
jgi:AraC-like DNA-binding protein